MELLMGIDTGYNMELFYPVASKLAEITKTPINVNKPILGKRTFQMGSGLLAEAFGDMSDSYDQVALLPLNPEIVGAPPVETVWGKGVGAKMIQKYAERRGINLDREQAGEVRDRIKKEAMIRKASISEFEVERMIKEASGGQ
jgi:isopropylmalate/homocitrate/citramalate synthase